MSNQGYIKLHRKIKDNFLWKKKRRFSKLEAWLDILLLANHKDNKVMIELQVIDIKKGQLLTSQLGLSKKWRWAVGSVNTFLKVLKAENQIEYKTENKYTIISILNWDKYQGNDKITETNTETNIETKLKTNYKQTETNKNVKNVKNEKNTIVSKADDEIFSFKKKLETMKSDKQRHIQIIALYWIYKEFSFVNKKQYQAGLRRELRPSKNLTGYSDDKISSVMDYLQNESDLKKWTLETVHKYIDEDYEEEVRIPDYAKDYANKN